MRYILLFIALFLTPSISQAMEINFFGVNPDDFKDRSYVEIAVGAVASLAVHEAGHFAMAEINGGGAKFEGAAVAADNYSEWSSGEQQMFHRAGFVAQMIVGSILTAVPKTRHSDFAVGFNGFTMVNSGLYVAVNPDGENSDIRQLNHGAAEGLAYTAASGVLTYHNLNKED